MIEHLDGRREFPRLCIGGGYVNQFVAFESTPLSSNYSLCPFNSLFYNDWENIKTETKDWLVEKSRPFQQGWKERFSCYVYMFFIFVLVGIGDPPGTMDMKAFLLQKFSDVERKEVTQLV